MLFSVASFLCCCALAPVWAQSSSSSSASPSSTSSASGTIYTLQAENITAKFIDLGARLTSLSVPDRNGNPADVAVGYDDYQGYVQDNSTNHTYFGAVVGRYANRIKNGTFTIDGVTSHIPENENGGKDTLHGGTEGYDGRIWNVTSVSNSSITFSLLDTAFEGFPGTVITYASYALSTEILGSPFGTPHPRLTTRLVSIALDSNTPIMLANHIYWNLNAFTSATILNDTTLWMPYSDRYIQIDTIEIPNGTLGAVSNYPVLDFTTPKTIGRDIGQAQGLCGYNCTGYDNAFILDRPSTASPTSAAFPVLSLWSQNTGIKLDVSTNQQGLQIYSCNGQNGTIPIKQSQIQRNQQLGINGTTTVNKYGCLVIETQAYIDGINNPQWGGLQYQIFSPETPSAENYATYDFTTF